MREGILIYLRIVGVMCVPLAVALVLYFPLRFLQRSRSEFYISLGLLAALCIVMLWTATSQALNFVFVADLVAFAIGLAAVLTFFQIQSRWLYGKSKHNHLHLRHLIQIGIALEERGADFYRACAEKAVDAQSKKLFQTLASDELSHKKIFQEILSRWLALDMKKSISQFLERKIAELKIFHQPPDQTAKISEVFNYALSQEERTEKFYNSLADYFPDTYRRTYLMRLIAEEQSHQRQLRRMQNAYGS